MISEFQSRKNKATLWSFMMENNFFEGIDNTYSNDIKAYFEKQVTHLATTIVATDSLVTLNKQVIADMMANNLKYKDRQPTLPIVTAGDITEQRQKVFNKVLESKQSEFNSLINKPTPSSIDFSDKADKPLGSEMDRMIADTIKWREQELNVVLQSQDQTEATKWINRDQPSVENTRGLEQEQQRQEQQRGSAPIEKPKFIKIGQSTTLDNIVELKQKHVSWGSATTEPEPEPEPEDHFLSMLKQKPDITLEEIKTMLIEIIDNQKLLLQFHRMSGTIDG